MRYEQIKPQLDEEILDEVKMSPSALQKFARSPEAEGMLMGVEFEMCVPNVSAGDDEPQWEYDYDQNERARDIDGIVSFFRDGEFSNLGPRAADRLNDDLQQQFWDWQSQKIYDDAHENTYEINRRVHDILENEMDWEDYVDEAEAALEAAGEMPDDEEDPDARSQAINLKAKELLEEAIDDIITEHSSREWESAFDQAIEEMQDEMREDGDYDEEAWLSDIGVDDMQDAEREWGLDWPHMYDANEGNEGDLDVDQVADEFSQAMGGVKVNTSNGYHGARRDGVSWIIEPDGSISPDDSDDGGLEFVSPPMPIAQGLEMIQRVYAWAKENDCYTNSSTGLHMNISVPDLTIDRLDYVKLALFLGDEHVLKQFGREYNTYCRSAMSKIRERVRPEDVGEILNILKKNLNSLASKNIHSGITDKYTSINTKDKYVEFRGPGGDYLDKDPAELLNTALRSAMALRIASDPEAYKQEYAKKLYKLIAQSPEDDDSVKLFSRYALGELPKDELLARVKFAQRGRKIEKSKRDTITSMLRDPKIKQEIQGLSPRWRDLLTKNLQSENEQRLQSTINTIEAGEYDDELTSEDRDLIISVIKNELAVREAQGEKKQYWVSNRRGEGGKQLVYAHDENEAILKGGKALGLNREQSIAQLKAEERVERTPDELLASLPDDWKEFYNKIGDASMGVLRGGLDSMTTGRWQYRNLDDDQVEFIKTAIEKEMRAHQEQGANTYDRRKYSAEIEQKVLALPDVVADWILNIPNKNETLLRDALSMMRANTWADRYPLTREQYNMMAMLVQDELSYRDATATEQEDGSVRLEFKPANAETSDDSVLDSLPTGWKEFIANISTVTDNDLDNQIAYVNDGYSGLNVSQKTYVINVLTQEKQRRAGQRTGSTVDVSSLPVLWQHWVEELPNRDNGNIQQILTTINSPDYPGPLTAAHRDIIRQAINQELERRGEERDQPVDHAVLRTLPDMFVHWLENIGDHLDQALINTYNNSASFSDLTEQQRAYFRLRIKRELRRRGIDTSQLAQTQDVPATPASTPAQQPTNTWADDAAERERMRREREQLAVDMQTQLVNRDDPVTSNDPEANDGPGMWLVGNHTYGRETLRANSREDAIRLFAQRMGINVADVHDEPGFVARLAEPEQMTLDLAEMRRLAGLV